MPSDADYESRAEANAKGYAKALANGGWKCGHCGTTYQSPTLQRKCVESHGSLVRRT